MIFKILIRKITNKLNKPMVLKKIPQILMTSNVLLRINQIRKIKSKNSIKKIISLMINTLLSIMMQIMRMLQYFRSKRLNLIRNNSKILILFIMIDFLIAK